MIYHLRFFLFRHENIKLKYVINLIKILLKLLKMYHYDISICAGSTVKTE